MGPHRGGGGRELFKPQGRLSVPEIEMSRGLLALGAHRPVSPLFTLLEASFSPCAEKLSQSQELEVVRPVQSPRLGIGGFRTTVPKPGDPAESISSSQGAYGVQGGTRIGWPKSCAHH